MQLVMATATLTKAVRALLDDVSAVRVDGGVKVCDLFPLFMYRKGHYSMYACKFHVYVYVCVFMFVFRKRASI